MYLQLYRGPYDHPHRQTVANLPFKLLCTTTKASYAENVQIWASRYILPRHAVLCHGIAA